MRLFFNYCKFYTLELFKNYSSLYAALFLPVIFLILFNNVTKQFNNYSLLSLVIIFCNFASQIIVLQILPMNIILSRENNFSQILRILPVMPIIMFAARIAVMLIVACISLTLIFLAQLMLKFYLPIDQWLVIIFFAILGAIPLALFGIALGFLISPNVAYFSLLGINLYCLFGAFDPTYYGGFMKFVHLHAYTHQWRLITENWLNHQFDLMPWLWLIGYGIFLYGCALLAHRFQRKIS